MSLAQVLMFYIIIGLPMIFAISIGVAKYVSRNSDLQIKYLKSDNDKLKAKMDALIKDRADSHRRIESERIRHKNEMQEIHRHHEQQMNLLREEMRAERENCKKEIDELREEVNRWKSVTMELRNGE